jgi:NTP pyrophosphatase (non-canonical NTP hydrolase)
MTKTQAERMTLQFAEFKAADAFMVALRTHNSTPVVDDDYPRARHYYEGALQTFLEALRANGRFDPGSRFNPAPPIGVTSDGQFVFESLREANARRQREWDADNQISLSYRGNELAGEVGEACNVIKKLDRERMGIKGSRDTVEHLAEELADVVICTDLIAMSEGIDLQDAVIRKFNATSEKVGLKTRMG